MKKNKIFKIGAILLGAVVLTGCTKSFATVQDKANVLATYERTVDDEGKTTIETICSTIETDGYHAPSQEFFDFIEEKVANDVYENYKTTGLTYLDSNENVQTYVDFTKDDLKVTNEKYYHSNEYALCKYAKENSDSLDDLWSNYNTWLEEAKTELGLDKVGSSYYHYYMQNTFDSYVSGYTSFITPKDFSMSGIFVEGKTWGEAFSYGFIEGLLVWPIAALLYYIYQGLSGLGIGGTILSVFFVTLIVRGILLLATFKQTASQQKMTQIQPEMAKIQAKYPNANTNQYEKQRMAQEQMDLYKKYKINPFGMIITLVIQFPVFIAVWGAMSGSAVLRVGDIGGLSLAASTGGSIIPWGEGSWVALIIFLVMALAQTASMLIPQYLQKKRTANVSKMGKNPAADQQAKTMKTMNIVMLIMIIFMGYQLNVAMTIYWIISAIISLIQSLVMQAISNKKSNNKNSGNKDKMTFTKYKTKKA